LMLPKQPSRRCAHSAGVVHFRGCFSYRLRRHAAARRLHGGTARSARMAIARCPICGSRSRFTPARVFLSRSWPHVIKFVHMAAVTATGDRDKKTPCHPAVIEPLHGQRVDGLRSTVTEPPMQSATGIVSHARTCVQFLRACQKLKTTCMEHALDHGTDMVSGHAETNSVNGRNMVQACSGIARNVPHTTAMRGGRTYFVTRSRLEGTNGFGETGRHQRGAPHGCKSDPVPRPPATPPKSRQHTVLHGMAHGPRRKQTGGRRLRHPAWLPMTNGQPLETGVMQNAAPHNEN